MNYKVSVVMAVYNSAEFLRQALESVINQTLQNIEIICVDDGSTDTSVEILNEYAKKDSRIKILYHKEKTPGAAGARNMGLEFATGEYLSFLDSDDFFDPEMLELAYEKAKKTDSDVVLWDGYVYDSKIKVDYDAGWLLAKYNLPDDDIFLPEDIKNNLFRINPGAAWNVLFKHDFVKKLDLKFADAYITDDQVFVYTAFACANKIAVIREKLMHYRRNNSDSQTGKATEHPEAGYIASEMLMEELKRRNKWDTYKIAFANMALEAALGYLDEMQTEESYEELFYALKNKYIEEFGLLDIPKEMYVNSEHLKKCELIIKGTPEAFLLSQYHKPMRISNFENVISVFDKTTRVIIYGAGDFGRMIFDELFRLKVCEICGWVDRDYEKIGFPISSPEVLKKTEVDYVLISIKNKNVANAVKYYLINMGIEEHKIIWIFAD